MDKYRLFWKIMEFAHFPPLSYETGSNKEGWK